MLIRPNLLTVAIPTDLPGVELREFDESTVDHFIEFYDRNRAHIAEFQPAASTFTMNEDEVNSFLAVSRLMGLVSFGIWHANELLGTADWWHKPDGVEIGYSTDKDHLRQGYARAAVRALIQNTNPDLGNVYGDVNYRNSASMSLLGSLGFVPVEIEGEIVRLELDKNLGLYS